jgi:hypothetical protein
MTKYNDKDVAILNVLKDAGKPLILAEIQSAMGVKIAVASIMKLVNGGFVAVAGKRVVDRKIKHSKIKTYKFVTDSIPNEKLTETETAIVAAAAKLDKPFTIADLSTAMGKTLKSGNVVGLLKKGNIAATGETVTVITDGTAEVNDYVYVKDITASN